MKQYLSESFWQQKQILIESNKINKSLINPKINYLAQEEKQYQKKVKTFHIFLIKLQRQIRIKEGLNLSENRFGLKEIKESYRIYTENLLQMERLLEGYQSWQFQKAVLRKISIIWKKKFLKLTRRLRNLLGMIKCRVKEPK